MYLLCSSSSLQTCILPTGKAGTTLGEQRQYQQREKVLRKGQKRKQSRQIQNVIDSSVDPPTIMST